MKRFTYEIGSLKEKTVAPTESAIFLWVLNSDKIIDLSHVFVIGSVLATWSIENTRIVKSGVLCSLTTLCGVFYSLCCFSSEVYNS
jgi:hypothetical protein